MEDPWANAWGDPAKQDVTTAIKNVSSSWSAPSVSVIHGDDEDDISTPEWSLKPTSSWGDPEASETTLWGSDVPARWNPAPSTFDGLSLASKESTLGFSSTVVESTSQLLEDSAHSIILPSNTNGAGADECEPETIAPHPFTSQELSSSSHTPVVAPFSLPPVDDVDGFGTFETAEDVSEEWETPSKPSFSLPSAEASTWGTEPWNAPSSDTLALSSQEETIDEWETARQQKEKQDRHVPPELLAAVLDRLGRLSSEIWSDDDLSENDQDAQEWHIDADSLAKQSTAQRLVPENLVLPTNTPFSKTFTSKQLSEALKLTRHSRLSRTSPMALYMASKGSTSWEAALKAKPNIAQEDVVPVGWKLLDSTEEGATVIDDNKKKSKAGLLSFFGRRGTGSITDMGKRSSSPAPGTASVKLSGSPRTSLDSTRRSVSHRMSGEKSTPPSPSVSVFATSDLQTTDLNLSSKTPSAPHTVYTDEIKREPSPPPLSAVSRFLGRFSSRPRSSSRDSIALSSDDLEFLSDVPSLTDPEPDSRTEGLHTIHEIIKSPPVLAVPFLPLSSPPKAPEKTSTTSVVLNRQLQGADFMSFFDNVSSEPDQPSRSGSPLAGRQTRTSIFDPSSPPSFSPISQPSSPTPPPLNIPADRIGISDRQSDQFWTSFDHPSALLNKPLPLQGKRHFVPIMSSSRPSSTTPPLLPGPGSFTLPPPPTSQRTDLLTGRNNSISLLSPPPTSSGRQSPRRMTQPARPISHPVVVDDDDDFADFLSSPAQPSNTGQLSFNFLRTQEAVPNSIQGSSAASGVNEIDDLWGSLPPQPPEKPNFVSSQAASLQTIAPKTYSASMNPKQAAGMMRKITRKADHSRTMSLLETAATRGRWLNPPSPLPEALQPPPNGMNGTSGLDLYNNGRSSMQAQQDQVIASLAASQSVHDVPSVNSTDISWNTPMQTKVSPVQLLGPPSHITSGPLKPGLTLLPSSMHGGNTSTTTHNTRIGALSAQDISFFEGL